MVTKVKSSCPEGAADLLSHIATALRLPDLEPEIIGVTAWADDRLKPEKLADSSRGWSEVFPIDTRGFEAVFSRTPKALTRLPI